MYKIFEVTYDDGGWHSGALPHFFYIGKTKEDVIEKSEKYQDFLERKRTRGGTVYIHEETGLVRDTDFENLKDFDVEVTIKEKAGNMYEL